VGFRHVDWRVSTWAGPRERVPALWNLELGRNTVKWRFYIGLRQEALVSAQSRHVNAQPGQLIVMISSGISLDLLCQSDHSFIVASLW
jgi:hypothetical protein